MPYGLTGFGEEQTQGLPIGSPQPPDQVQGQLINPMGGAQAPWDPTGSMGVNPYQGLPQNYSAMDAEYHALHEDEAQHKLEELDKAAKFRRALGMLTETFAVIAGRDDIAALSRKQLEQEDAERAERVQAQILAHVGMRALERERSERQMDIAKLESGERKVEMQQTGAEERERMRIESAEDRAATREAGIERRHKETLDSLLERQNKRLAEAEARHREELDLQKKREARLEGERRISNLEQEAKEKPPEEQVRIWADAYRNAKADASTPDSVKADIRSRGQRLVNQLKAIIQDPSATWEAKLSAAEALGNVGEPVKGLIVPPSKTSGLAKYGRR